MPGCTSGRHDAVQILRLDVIAFRRAAQQDGQRIARFLFGFDQAGQGGFLLRHDRFLFRQVQVGGHAAVHLGLGDGQNALGGGDVGIGDGDAFAERKDREILIRHLAGNRDAGHGGGIAHGPQVFARGLELEILGAEEALLIARGQARH